MNHSPHLAASVDGLIMRFSNRELLTLVRERHPAQKEQGLSDFELFEHTYVEVHGPDLCDVSRARLQREFEQFQDGNDVPVYFVRCLLPGFSRGSAV